MTTITRNQAVGLVTLSKRAVYTAFSKPPLSEAVLPNGKISCEHPAVAKWLSDHATPGGLPDQILRGDVTASSFLDMTVKQIFEGANGTIDNVKLLKELAAIRKNLISADKAELEYRKQLKELVPLELVKTLVDHIDALQVELLQSTAKTIANDAHTMALAGESKEAITRKTRERVSRTIKAVKAGTDRRLRDV